jgi:hypothetical protein
VTSAAGARRGVDPARVWALEPFAAAPTWACVGSVPAFRVAGPSVIDSMQCGACGCGDDAVWLWAIGGTDVLRIALRGPGAGSESSGESVIAVPRGRGVVAAAVCACSGRAYLLTCDSTASTCDNRCVDVYVRAPSGEWSPRISAVWPGQNPWAIALSPWGNPAGPGRTGLYACAAGHRHAELVLRSDGGFDWLPADGCTHLRPGELLVLDAPGVRDRVFGGCFPHVVPFCDGICLGWTEDRGSLVAIVALGGSAQVATCADSAARAPVCANVARAAFAVVRGADLRVFALRC